MLRKKNRLSWFMLAVFMMAIVFSAVPAAPASAASISDIQGHWAATTIQKMVDQGVVTGMPDGSFKPDNSISRAEFATLVVKAFKLDSKDGKVFNDTSKHWAKDYIATANAYGILNGYSDTIFGPDDPITREQMAVMVVKASKLPSSGAALSFSDSTKVSDWAKDAVATASAQKILTGFPDGSFQPQAKASRAQAVVALSNALQLVNPVTPLVDLSKLDKAGTYGPSTGNQDVSGNVTISSSGVTLQNATISGDLLITDAVGSGEVTLKNVTVKGTTTINGGGTIHLINCVLGKVIIKTDSSLKISLEGTSIGELIANSAVTISGQGTITKATINKAGVVIEIKPGSTTVASGLSAIIAGVTVYGTSSGGGGGSSSSSVATVTASPAAGPIAAGTTVTVTLSCATSGATIYYTTDGITTPTSNSTKYTDPISVNAGTTIMAIAVKSSYNNSSVSTFKYSIASESSVITVSFSQFVLLKGVIKGTVSNASVTSVKATDTQGNTATATVNADRTFELSSADFTNGDTVSLQAYINNTAAGNPVSTTIGGSVAPAINTTTVSFSQFVLLKGVIKGTVSNSSITTIIATDTNGNTSTATINADRTFEVSSAYFTNGDIVSLQAYINGTAVGSPISTTINIGDNSGSALTVTYHTFLIIQGVIKGTVNDAAITSITATDLAGNTTQVTVTGTSFEIRSPKFTEGSTVTLQGYNASNVAVGSPVTTTINVL